MNNGFLLIRQNHLRTVLLCLACGLSLMLSSSAFSQTTETSDSIRFKTLGVLYRCIGGLNSRNVRFKALQDELEDMHPFGPQNMDSAHFATNLAQVAKYLLFLQAHRSQLTKDVKLFSDSINMLMQLVSKEEEKKALTDFLSAYKEETAAFILYSQYFSVMLTDIRKTIIFLQGVPMEHIDGNVSFKTDRSANDKFMEYQSTIAGERAKVDEAIERSITLTEKENKIIQQTLSLFNR